jgi:hypothetical protein
METSYQDWLWSQRGLQCAANLKKTGLTPIG